MKVMSGPRSLLVVALVALAILAPAVLTTPARIGAQSVDMFVLTTAGDWGAEQDAAVAAAGGTISYSHGKAGIGVVTSTSPDFLREALATGAFNRGAKDMSVRWQPPIREGGVLEAGVTPGDETFANLQWNVKAVEAEGAWAAGYTGQGVRVAVIDGGIYTSHIDLAGQVDTAHSKSFVPGRAFDEDTGTFWHATHVAGIIAAKDNSIGTIGIAPDATIIGVKVLHSGSGTFGALISGILYAAIPIEEGGAGADIINLSVGAAFPRGRENTGVGTLVAALNKAVNYASEHALVVCAAGNDAIDLDHSGSLIMVPAMSGRGIAISATGPLGYAVGYPNGATNFRRPASYTNHGNSLVWLAAPGGDDVLPGQDVCTVPRVPSGSDTQSCWVFDMVISTCRGSGSSVSSYTWADGTSMAAPAASAVAALVKQRFPGMTVGELATWLARTADDEGKAGHDPYYGRGFVNARRGVTQ